MFASSESRSSAGGIFAFICVKHGCAACAVILYEGGLSLKFPLFLTVDMSQLELFELYPVNVCVLFAGKACTRHDFLNSVVYA